MESLPIERAPDAMEFLRLRYLLVAAEELNLRRAAKLLGVTQPALTRQIATLEAELGFEVLLRHQQRLVGLTRPGERFVADAHRILVELEDAANAGRAIARGAVGRLRIGICEEAIGAKLATVLRASRVALPEVELALVEMQSAAQPGALHDNTIDLGVLVAPAETGSLAIDLLWREGKVVALPESHSLAQQARVSMPDLLAAGLMLGGDLQGQTEEEERDPALTRGPYAVRRPVRRSTAVVLAQAGIGAAILPASLEALSLPGVTLRPLDAPETAIAAAWRIDEGSGLVLEVLRAAKAALASPG